MHLGPFGRATVTAVAASVAFLVGLLPVHGSAELAYADGFLIATATTATVALARRARLSGDRMRATWAWNAAACGSWAAGMVVWSVLQLSGDELPFPSVADAGFFLTLPLAAFGVLAHPGVKPAIRGRSAVDGLIAAVATALGVWALLQASMPDRLRTVDLPDVVAIAHPVTYAALAAVIAFTAARWRGGEALAAAMLAVGWGCLAAVSLAYGWHVLRGDYHSGHPLDAGYVATFAFLASTGFHAPVVSQRRRLHVGRAALAGPYLPLLVALGAVATGRVDLDPVLATGGVSVLVLVIVRQYLTLLENQALARELEGRVAARTAELATSESRYRHALAGARVGSFEVNSESGRVYWSPEAEAIYGVAPGTFDGTVETARSFMHPDDAAAVSVAMQGLDEGEEQWIELRINRADGKLRWLECRASLRTDADGRRLVVGVLTDVTERKLAEAELERLAHTDTLTGLPNRARLQQALTRASELGMPVVLLVMDLDGFKDVNDGLGHELGDRFLVEVAARLRSGIRQGDLVARLGGDEFAVVLPDTDDPEVGATVAQQILAALGRPVEVAGLRLPVAASVGIAAAPHHGTTPGDLLRHADVAMYRAKERGGTWAVYGEDTDGDRTDRLALLADLREAIDEGAIEVHYQPQVELATGRVASVEALARWTHPVRGAVSPSEFVPLAEHSGLIRDLTPLVLRTALAQCRRWRAEGFDIGLSVNVSPRQLHDPDLVPHIDRALLDARVPPAALTVEITEGAFADETPAVAQTLADLRAIGVRLSVDDFGTGYSSLAYLKRLPVEEVKIDRSFIAGLPGHADVGIVRAVLELARHLGLAVVAEGVEDADALASLRGWGCTYAQGFLLSHPLAAEDLTALLAATHDELGAASGHMGP